MPAKAGYWTSMLHVADVKRSIAFYESLGFELIDTEGDGGSIGWARLHCEGGAIMLFLAEEEHPVEVSRIQAVPAYMYTEDLAGLRERLHAAGAKVSKINHPPYMRSGEIRVEDPDGYVIFVGHWGDAEHSAWLARIEEKRRAGTLRP